MLKAFLIPVLAACLALAACGGDDDGDGGSDNTVSAEAYATDVCVSTQEWVSDLQTRATDLSKSLGTNVTAAEGKDALSGFMANVITDTDDWVQDVTDAGTPDVDGGEQAAEDFRKAAEDAKRVLEDTKASVDDLPTGNEQAFSREATKVGDATQESLGKVGDAMSARDSEALRTAFAEVASCKKLAAG